MADRKIVIAVDGSDCSRYALNYYCDQIHKANDVAEIVYVADIPVSILKDAKEVADSFKNELARVEQMKAELVGILRNKGIKGEAKMLTDKGKPEDAIVKHATEENADMIVIGSRGLSKFKRTFLGSVSDHVVHHSACPVIVIKMPQEGMDVDQKAQ